MTVVNENALAEAHHSIDRGIESGDAGGLNVVGFGEITLAVAWPTADPRTVVKRLPPFRTRAELENYRALLADWTAEVQNRGVAVVETTLHTFDHPRWGTLGYLVQPLLRPEELAVTRCQQGTDGQARDVLAAVVDAIGRAVDERVSFDAQLTNWVVRADGSIAMMDVSTPFLRDAAGRDRLSTALFVRGYPAALRPALARVVLPSVIDAYHTPRTAVRDFAGNLIRLGLERHLDFVLAQTRERLGIDLPESEVREFFEKDSRMWGVLQSRRHVDNWWQRTVRRRPYPALLPPKYDARTDYNFDVR